MIVRFHGTRGSIPATGDAFKQFGGNTSCVSIDNGDGKLLIVDAGTGVYHLGHEDLSAYEHLQFVFTHFHWDHIQGLPFFRPLYDKSRTVELSVFADSKLETLQKALCKQMDPEFFPIGFEQMGATLQYSVLDNPMIEPVELNHPGGCYGFKITAPSGQQMAYLVDHELTEENRSHYVEFCKGVDVLVHDAHYTSDQYMKYQGWGHTCAGRAMTFAEEANVGRLILTHHHPDHNDAFLLNLEKQCQSVFKHSELAKEDLVVEL